MALRLFNVFDVPVALHCDVGQCGNGCIYCYSYKRCKNKTTVQQVENMLNYDKPDTLKGYYIKNRYPVAVSNNSDLNSSNDPNAFEVVRLLKNAGFPIFFETKGCHDYESMDRFLNLVTPEDSVYITLSTLADDSGKIIEPNAPSVEKRMELIDELVQKKVNVIVAFNPAIPGYVTDEQIIEYISEHKDLSFFMYHLHLPSWSKLEIKKLPKYNFANVAKYCEQNGIVVTGANDFFWCKPEGIKTREHFKKKMIIASDIAEVVKKYRAENSGWYEPENNITNLVTFDDFYKEKKDMFIDAIVDQSDIYMGRNHGSYFRGILPQKMTYKDYIKLCFDNPDKGLIFSYAHSAWLRMPDGAVSYFDYRGQLPK